MCQRLCLWYSLFEVLWLPALYLPHLCKVLLQCQSLRTLMCFCINAVTRQLRLNVSTVRMTLAFGHDVNFDCHTYNMATKSWTHCLYKGTFILYSQLVSLSVNVWKYIYTCRLSVHLKYTVDMHYLNAEIFIKRIVSRQ